MPARWACRGGLSNKSASEVLDRKGLEKRTCECYAVVRREYARLLPHEEAI